MASETGIVPKCLPSFCERRANHDEFQPWIPCTSPGKPVFADVGRHTYKTRVRETHCMETPELLLKVCPSGDPLLRGYCSACLDTTFVFAVNTEENQRLMQQAFNIHVQEVHILVDLAGCRAVLKSAPAANASPYAVTLRRNAPRNDSNPATRFLSGVAHFLS